MNALLSVSDKTGIVEFARALHALGTRLLSTGATPRLLADAALPVTAVAELTGFPEMLDGRVKTLHPRVHGGLLAVRDDAGHVAAMSEHGIEPIDMAVINLYPFEQTVARAGTTLEEAVEQIDIGGPAMVRSAAKNHADVAVVTAPELYADVLAEMREHDGALTAETRSQLALLAFARTALYDANISLFLSTHYPLSARPAWLVMFSQSIRHSVEAPARVLDAAMTEIGKGGEVEPALGDQIEIALDKIGDLRYGENPHQVAALYATGETGVATAEVLAGKEMSFNNYIDADAAWQLVNDFEETACAIIKHTNPAGCALGATPEEAYRRALATDPVSAFGGIVAFNRAVDEGAARAVTEIFTEVVVAPGYDEAALAVLRAKKNLRVLLVKAGGENESLLPDYDYKKISGGMLVQTRDTRVLSPGELKVVTRRAPTEEELDALRFAWTVCKHTKSNAIVYARAGQTVGVGAGQMSRVDSVRIGAARARAHGLDPGGSVLASDAFFPFRDGLDEAARQRITAVIQPGGSVRDAEVIAAADEHDLAMVFTGARHFKH